MIKRLLFRVDSLRARILLLFLVTISIVTLLTLYLAQDAAYLHSRQQLEVHHLAASRVIADRLETRAKLLTGGLSDLTGNFSVKQLVASAGEDPGSLVAAMDNYRRRLGADMFAVFDGDGQVLVSSLPLDADTLRPQQYSSDELTWLDIDKAHYLFKTVPLRFVENSPRVNAWLAMGQLSNSLIDEELVALTGLQVSLLDNAERHQVWGSTLDSNTVVALAESLRGVSTGLIEVTAADEEYIVGLHELDSTPSVVTMVSQPQASAYLPYQALLLRLGLLLMVAAMLAALAAMRISLGISRPINKLVVAANRISRGENADDLPKRGTKEVSVLTRSIIDMQDGIREREKEINRLAYYDPLTNLPNRNRFTTFLEKSLQESDGESLTIALMDVDHFKEINDTVGHSIGDRLLELIALRLAQWSQDGDFIARMGGDEFAVITSRFRNHNPSLLGEEITSLFEHVFSLNGLQVDVNMSVGIAVAPEHGDNAPLLLRRADIAMYSCKGGHGAFAVYQDELDQHSVQRLSLMSELKEAIADGQLSLHYQPKLNLVDGVVDCAECLIRWQHPTYGFVRPDEFIGLAEQTGSIRLVTHWALNSALKQQAEWARQGIKMNLAVNISAVDLCDMSLPAYVGELQTRYNLSPESLTLEITESAIMQDPDSAMLALKNLRRMGVLLSIDDFGTGFSSMAQLKIMPVNELKIDKAFVLNLAHSKEDRVMVQSLVSLAHNLGLKTVAEGVEDADSLEVLKSLDCDSIQGYHLGRPMPVTEFETWLEEQQCPEVRSQAI